MSHNKTDMRDQQFNDHWNQIFKLLTDLDNNISILYVVIGDDLRMYHEKCF